MTPAEIAQGLWTEYLRVDEWCVRSYDDPHSAKVAIRCVATRLGVYDEFVALDLPIPIRDKTGDEPCGECHLHLGEVCDICGAQAKEPKT